MFKFVLFLSLFMQHPTVISVETNSVVTAGITAKSPWKKVLDVACKDSIADVMCQFKNLVSTYSHWKVKHVKGEAGADINQADTCLDQQNSNECNTGQQIKKMYKKMQMTPANSKVNYVNRFPEDNINGWTKQQLDTLFKGIEQIPDKQQLSGFQSDYFQTDAILQLMAQVRLLAIRMDDYKIASQLYAATSLFMTMFILVVYSGILSYVAFQKCKAKMSVKRERTRKAF